MFGKVVGLLRQRHVYSGTLWSYGVYHNQPEVIREYLPHTSFADQCGLYIKSDLLALEPVSRHVYQHKEYWPLVSPRVHQARSYAANPQRGRPGAIQPVPHLPCVPSGA